MRVYITVAFKDVEAEEFGPLELPTGETHNPSLEFQGVFVIVRYPHRMTAYPAEALDMICSRVEFEP